MLYALIAVLVLVSAAFAAPAPAPGPTADSVPVAEPAVDIAQRDGGGGDTPGCVVMRRLVRQSSVHSGLD